MAESIIPHKRSPQSKNKNLYSETVCIDCGARQMRRSDAIKKWNGRCRKCASKINNSRPEIRLQRIARRLQTISEWPEEKKAQSAERARQQVLKQGGVPNAKSFVKEGQEGRRMAGENHYAWKGDLAYLNRSARLVDMGRNRYKTWRKAVFGRDDYTCQFCGQRGGKLEADHVLPYSTHVELRYEVSNGRTLCNPCHRTTETYGARALRFKN